MTPESFPQRQTPPYSATPSMIEGSYLDWSAILAGGIFALAISFLLITFGAGLGLSLTSPYRGEGVSAAWLAIASGIWFVWVMVTGFGAGGYLAGRMRRRVGDATPDEVGVRDGTHGLMVWAVGALVSTVLATASVGGLLTAGVSAAGSARETITGVASDAASLEYFANVMLRSGEETHANAGDDTPAAEDEGANPVVGGAIDGATPDTGTGTPPTTRPNVQVGTELTNIDPAFQQEVAGILARSATSGEMADRDRSHLARLVAANTDLDPEASLDRIDEINGEIAEARSAAIEATDDARVAGVVFGFIAAATLLIGAIAAFFSATAGGRHRDEGLGLDVLVARN